MRTVLLLSSMCLVSAAWANDGWIGNSGAPKLMKGHPIVRMVREIVWMTVGRKHTDVSCVFWFRNEGPATKVRIGFPDEDSGREDGVDSVFDSFTSTIDDKPTKTVLVQEPQGSFWQVKTVAFRKGQTVVVRNRYRVRTGGGISIGNTAADETGYTLHTGASWKGPIGRVDVYVTFDRSLPQPGKVTTFDQLENQYGTGVNAPRRFIERNRNTVFYKGFAKPKVIGRTLRFTTRNLEPTRNDNIHLTFAHIIPPIPSRG